MDVKPTSPSDGSPQVSDAQRDASARSAPSQKRGPSDPVAALLDAALNQSALDASPQDQTLPPSSAPPEAARSLHDVVKTTPAPENPAGIGPDHPEFQAIIRADVLAQVSAHADEFPDTEVCGVLTGTVYEETETSFVHVDGMVRGENTTSRSTAVTFTAETWQHIHKVMEEQHPGKRILAWYHTHPGFGIFLSEMDLFIQRHFFDAPWQMAFVFDPKSRESGMFAWRQGQVRRIEYVVDEQKPGAELGDAFPSLPNLSKTASVAESSPAAANPRATAELVERIRTLESRVKLLSIGFAILIVVAIIWPLLVPLMLPSASNAERQQGPGSPALPGSDAGGGKPANPPPVLPLPSD